MRAKIIANSWEMDAGVLLFLTSFPSISSIVFPYHVAVETDNVALSDFSLN
jgi:hypothetical protein